MPDVHILTGGRLNKLVHVNHVILVSNKKRMNYYYTNPHRLISRDLAEQKKKKKPTLKVYISYDSTYAAFLK